MGVRYSGLSEVRQRVDLERYAGLWYEIARSRDIPFEPEGTHDVRAHYTVVNGQFTIRNECIINGRPVKWTSFVRSKNDDNSRFELDAGGRGPGGVYRILELDYENYSWAVVGGDDPTRAVWILAREPRMPRELFLRLVRLLEEFHHFDARTLVVTRHTAPEETASPHVNVMADAEPVEAEIVRGDDSHSLTLVRRQAPRGALTNK